MLIAKNWNWLLFSGMIRSQLDPNIKILLWSLIQKPLMQYHLHPKTDILSTICTLLKQFDISFEIKSTLVKDWSDIRIYTEK
jgi:hypothetical protein